MLPVAVAAQCPKIVAILCRTGLSPELALEVKAFDLLAPQTIVATFLQMLKQQHQSFGDNPPVVLASLNAFIEHYPQHIPEVCEQFVDLLEQEMESGALDAWDFALYCSALGNSLSKRKTTTEGIYVSPMTVDKIFDKWFPTDKEQPRFTHYKALTHLVKNRLDMEDVSTGLIRKIATYLLQKINDFETRWQIICASGDNLLQKAAYTLIEGSQVDLIKWPRQWSLWSFLNSSFHYALATRDEQLMLEYVERKPKEFHKFLQSQCFLYSAFSKANPIIKSDFRSNPHYPLYARVYAEISKPNGSRKFARFRKDSALKKFFAGKDEVVEQPKSLEALYQRILTVKTLAEAKAVVRSAFLSNPELFKRQLGQWLARTATLSLRVLLALLSQIDLPASFINHMTSGNRPAVILTDLIKNQKTRLLALFLKMLQEKKVQLDFAKTLGTEFYFNALYLAGQAQQFELADTLLANHDDPLPYRLTQLAGALNLPADILQLSRPLNFREKAALNQLLTQPAKFIATIKRFIERYPQHTEEICERFIALANDTIDLNSQDLYKVFLLLFFTDKTAKRPQYKLSSEKLTATAIAQIKKWFAEADDDFDVGTVKKLLEQLSPKEVKDIATAMNNPVMIWAVAFVADKPLRNNLREAARRAVEDNIIDIKTAQERWASSPLADEKQLEKFLGKFHYALATEDVEKMFKIFKRNPRKFHEQLQQAWRTPRQQSPHLRFYLKLWLQLRRQVTAEYADPGIFPNPVAVQKYKKLFESVFHYKLSKDPVCFFNDGNYYRQNVDVLWHMLHVAQKSKTGIANLLNTHKDDEDTLKEFRQLLTLYEKNILANDKTFNAFLTFVKNKLANPELNLVREAGTHSTLYPDNKAGLPGPAGPHPSSAYPNSAL